MGRIARDIMHVGVKTIPVDTELGEVTRHLTEQEVHAIFVTEGDSAIAGVISDLDLLAGEWLFTDEESLNTLRSMTAGELMSSPVSAVEASETIEAVSSRMIDESIHRLLVTDNGEPVGVVSVSDIVQSFGGQKVVNRTVAEVASQAFVVCRPDAPLTSIARGMTCRHTRSVVVVDREGKALGVVTGTDLLLASRDEFDDRTASDVMNEPITISPEASLREAADKMIKNRIHRLLVIDSSDPDALPLGIISTADIISAMAQSDSDWQT